VANPDLPRRLAEGLPLASFDPKTLFGGDERGYTDYPSGPLAVPGREALRRRSVNVSDAEAAACVAQWFHSPQVTQIQA
jgi:hypothetical protein